MSVIRGLLNFTFQGLHKRQGLAPSLPVSTGCYVKHHVKVPRWQAIPEAWGCLWSGELLFHLHQAHSKARTFHSLKYQTPAIIKKYSSVPTSQKIRLKRHLIRTSSTWMTYTGTCSICFWTLPITPFPYPVKLHAPQFSIQTARKFCLKPVTTNLASRYEQQVTHFFNMAVFATYHTNPSATLGHFSKTDGDFSRLISTHLMVISLSFSLWAMPRTKPAWKLTPLPTTAWTPSSQAKVYNLLW